MTEKRADGQQTNSEEPTVIRLPRHHDSHSPDVELHQTVQGSKPGTRFLRRMRAGEQKLRRVGEGEFEATRAASEPTTRLGRVGAKVRHVLIGEALASSQLNSERLTKVKALAIFSSDNLSSSAYATEEILLILILAGTAALTDAIPIAIGIAVLAAIVATSYRQTIRAYPNGGGAYIVAKENLGVRASLIAGSALFVDYVLTVAVSTAAGVAAISSALPELHDFKIEIAVGFVTLLTLGNLRGIRESGTIFAIPTYFFIFTFATMIVVGLVRVLAGDDLTAVTPAHPIEEGTHALTLFLLLRAFSSGCAALTGIEAIANGVPYFKAPEARNAGTTLVWMAIILSAFFLGSTFLAHQFGVVPAEGTTVVAQIAQTVFGHSSPFFYMVQVATAMILILAANTSFAGLPAAASVMAQDKVMPQQFAFRGDRLAFSNGIIVVGIASSILLVVFQADTHKLIPLYAFGVFTAFTLSQAGMVLHWRRHREEPGWRSATVVNTVGAIATGIVALIIAATKFLDGAWLSIAFMTALALVLWRIREHYASAERQLEQGLEGPAPIAERYFGSALRGSTPTIIIPVDRLNHAVLKTVAYARSLSSGVTGVHVALSKEEAELLRERWEASVPDVPLVIVDSPYRSLVEPLIAYIDAAHRSRPDQMVTVVLPEFITHRTWHRFLHNQLSSRLKKELLKRSGTVVVDVPFHLEE